MGEGIIKYEEAMESFDKARELSLSQSQGIIASSSDIESDFLQIEKYQDPPSKKLLSLKIEYKDALKNLNDGNLKTGMNSIEKTRLEVSNLKKEVLLPIAKEKANKANESITETEKELASKNLNLENNDNLAISKESYNKSIDLIGKDRYYDSIQESEKAIELCSSTLRDKNLLAISKTKENKTEASSKEIKTKENQISSKFIKYIVMKKNPPETLWKIAADKKNLGDKHKWKKIYQANKKTISDPDKIYPNQVILIPRK